jgi:hypothetical protein
MPVVELEHGAAERLVAGQQRFGGLHVPQPEFADDDGSADPRLAEVLAAYDRDEVGDRDVVDALRGTRLMTPLVAVLDESDGEPLPGEKDSHMASVSMVAADGRRGLLAFTSVAAMAAWDPAARGVPASASTVAAAALEEGAVAVLLDVGGPVRYALLGSALQAVLADVDLPVPFDDPDVRAAVVEVLETVPGLVRADLQPAPAGPHGDLADLLLLVEPAPDVDPDAVADALAEALGRKSLLQARCVRGVAVGLLPGGR